MRMTPALSDPGADIRKGFTPAASYLKDTGYSLLPIRFTRLDGERTIITNLAGESLVAPSTDVPRIARHQLSQDEPLFDDLVSRHMIATEDSSVHLDLIAAKVRTKLHRLPDLTALHLFVVTLRCDHTCQYCQVSRVSEDRRAFDMSEETALAAIDMMFRSPSPHLKVEFQGGEPLLNFPIVQFIVEEVEKRKGDRNVQYVIASNLSQLTDDILDYCAERKVFFSTSLDGPESLHNGNRPRPDRNSYQVALQGIRRIRERMGHDAVSALMTTTLASLDQPEAVIDEYVAQGFTEIFLRYVSPYGFAVKSASRIGYETDQFIAFYKRGLAHILKLNKEGMPIREIYASLLLRRMLTPYADGYVDLQSPAGMGLSVLAYDYDGHVYSSDEGRMLAAMGDTTFRLGRLGEDAYETMMAESHLLPILHETMTEAVPMCCDCAFQPWCGTDPVFHHRTQRDFIGHRPTSAFCRRNMAVIKHLVRLLEDDPEAASILKGWI